MHISVSAAFFVMADTDLIPIFKNALDILYAYSDKRSDYWCNTSWHQSKLFNNLKINSKGFSQNDETCSITLCKFTKHRKSIIIGSKLAATSWIDI